MDSAELLDILGNANRRRILRLLSQKPCYVTEISEYLGVSPKAVIDHLRKLEESDLVESRTDEKRRKYFSISRVLRLEVSVSPYKFGTKSAYPASSGLDISRCSHVDVQTDHSDPTELPELARALRRLEAIENELSLAQRWAQGQLTEIRERLADAADDADPRLVTAVLRALADEPADLEELSRRIDVPPSVVESVLTDLAAKDVVVKDRGTWRLPD
jgi:ArsR family transcriptional regulator